MIKKILTWIAAFLPTILGILEAALKLVKEILTLVVDILFPVIPIDKFKTFVTNLRGIVDKIYDWISYIKEKLLEKLGL